MTGLFELFLAFLQIGAFSIGGGYAAIPLIQSLAVEKYGWLSISEFTDLVTIAEMTPRTHRGKFRDIRGTAHCRRPRSDNGNVRVHPAVSHHSVGAWTYLFQIPHTACASKRAFLPASRSRGAYSVGGNQDVRKYAHRRHRMVGARRGGCELGGTLHVCGGILPASQIQKQPDTRHADDGRRGSCRGTYYGLN